MSPARPSHDRRDFGDPHPWPVAITIPACNEAAHILRCLDAARTALRGRGGIVLAVNGSQDATWDKARTWFEETRTPGILLDLPITPAGGVGAVRHHAVTACARQLTPGGAVMTTDADSTVFPDWVDANLDELRHADLICGTVIADPTEFARLPPSIARLGAIEGEYVALTLAARRLLAPIPHDPDPSHLNEPGASLAFTMPLYRDVGGFPALTGSEDRIFAATAEARAWRLRHSAQARVSTSCRLEGRAPGGMAEALAGRITGADPLVDETLEPAAETLLRARLHHARRECLSRGRGAESALAAIETRLAAIERKRMRLSDVARETPLLARELSGLTGPEERETA
ncbi:MAG: glycosyltransferase family 2 protein [Roseovarius sp.]